VRWKKVLREGERNNMAEEQNPMQKEWTEDLAIEWAAAMTLKPLAKPKRAKDLKTNGRQQ